MGKRIGKSPSYRLDSDELASLIEIGTSRNKGFHERGQDGLHEGGPTALFRDINSAIGEFVVHKLTGLVWAARYIDIYGDDVANLEVKASEHYKGDLIFRRIERYSDDHIFVLVTGDYRKKGHQGLIYTMAGWGTVALAKEKGYKKSYQDNGEERGSPQTVLPYPYQFRMTSFPYELKDALPKEW